MIHYVNGHLGKTAYIIGKGPSFSRFFADHNNLPDGVLIGINQIGSILDVHYSFACDDPTVIFKGVKGGVCFQAYPFNTGDIVPTFAHYPQFDWFVHWPGEWELLSRDREWVARRRALFTVVNSSNPAIHFAWLIGCSKAILVGIGEEGGYAPECQWPKVLPWESDFVRQFNDFTKPELDILFPNAWERYV